jgi:hypothetical protein
MEENISEIFSLFHEFKLKNLIQNTAISFSVCVEDKFDNFNELNAILSKKIQSRLQSKCNLYTIRHFNDSAADTVENGKKVVLKQISTETMQIVTRAKLLDYYSPIDCGDFINVGSILSRLDSTFSSVFTNIGKQNVDLFREEIYTTVSKNRYI